MTVILLALITMIGSWMKIISVPTEKGEKNDLDFYVGADVCNRGTIVAVVPLAGLRGHYLGGDYPVEVKGEPMTFKRWVQLRYYALHRIFPRFKLWRICKALGIEPYPWQKAYALGKTESLPREVTRFRATGKTTAVLLRLLMVYPGQPFDILQILHADPDFITSNKLRVCFYEREYMKLSLRCYEANIPVMTHIRLYPLCDQFNRRRRQF